MPPRGVELVGLLPNSGLQPKSDVAFDEELQRDPVGHVCRRQLPAAAQPPQVWAPAAPPPPFTPPAAAAR